MNALRDAISDLVSWEAVQAQRKHGESYASHNEGYGVLAEEVQEASDELGDALKAIGRTAVNAAAEAIQVAAVCRKWLEGLEAKRNG